MKRNLTIGIGFCVLFIALGLAHQRLEQIALAQNRAGVQAPRFEVDPLWPKPLPNHWVLGQAIGIWADAQDNFWIIHRGSDTLNYNERGLELKSGDCCAGSPPVLVFDKAGNLIRSWGGPGPGYDWPDNNHGIFVDHTGSVWIGGNGPGDSHIVKFTQDGKFLAQYGKPNARLSGEDAQGNPTFARNSHDMTSFGRVAEVVVEPKANEAYLADGYFNKRVAVLDAATGKMKRYWGAYGNKPDDTNLGRYNPDAPPAQQFRNPVHCAELSNDGLLYVCDRANNRIQVFRKDGTFVKETQVAKNTLGDGVVFDIAFSHDKPQRHLFISDGANHRIWTLLRDPLQVVSHFGSGGRYPGQFYAPHNVSLDSKGNIYTVETYEGKRLQKFNYKGIGSVRATTN